MQRIRTTRRADPQVASAAPVSLSNLEGVRVLSVSGPLSAVAVPAREAVLAQWVRCPPAVLCDLSEVRGLLETGAVDVLASLGAQVRQWPGIPIGLVCPQPDLRNRLTAAPEARHLLIGRTCPAVLHELRDRAAADTWRVSLTAQPQAPRAARELVAAACAEWGCSHLVPTATLVASELATNAVVHAGTELEVSISRCGPQIRVAVRDHSDQAPTPLVVEPDAPTGRGMLLVEALSTSWGVLLTRGGKVVWAVLPAEAAAHRRAGGVPAQEPTAPG
jgi:anti-sigma regulatory factor (Ser/Thr protein kinase)